MPLRWSKARYVMSLIGWLISVMLCSASAAIAAANDASDGVAFFESKIRPLLANRCYQCHAQTARQVQGGLRLDSRGGILQGGDSGPVIVAGQVANSPLIEAIGYAGDIAEHQEQVKLIEASTPHYHSAKAHALEDAALYVMPEGKDHTKLEYKPGEALDLCIHIRGNPARPGLPVPRRFLTVLSTDPPQAFQNGSGRLELAQAVLNEGAPLSARVIVNRVWKHHFGRGLVETLSDFGTQGARPSHPELLDDLTCRFVEHGWSLKWLHRELMLSATYQQASTYDSGKFRIDPDNRWLWRTNRRRLDIEAWRDSLLTAGGNLDQRLGGPPVVLAAEGNRRRTLYAKIDRADLDDLLRLFDFPDPATHSPDRDPTTTALQQLFVLNSPFMRQQAKALAELLLAGGAMFDETIVRHAYGRLFAREPSPTELQLGVEFLGAQSSGTTDAEQLQAYAQVLLGSSEFLLVD